MAPLLAGVNVTLTVQVPPLAANGKFAQLPSVWNSGSLDVMLPIENGTPVLFVSTTGFDALVVVAAWFPNGSVFFGATFNTPWMPIPTRVTICGLLCALSVSVSVPDCLTKLVGVKVNAITHGLPGSSIPVQVVSATSSAKLAFGSGSIPSSSTSTPFLPPGSVTVSFTGGLVRTMPPNSSLGNLSFLVDTPRFAATAVGVAVGVAVAVDVAVAVAVAVTVGVVVGVVVGVAVAVGVAVRVAVAVGVAAVEVAVGVGVVVGDGLVNGVGQAVPTGLSTVRKPLVTAGFWLSAALLFNS